MEKIFTEENGCYKIDCSRAIWATDQLHLQYIDTNSVLSDVDWIMETNRKIYLVEYKNADIPDASNPMAFRPADDGKINKVAKKFYDSLHYLNLLGKTKPKEYIYILEYPNGDSTSRRMIRNLLKSKLPFALQENIGNGKKIIDSVNVFSIEEWNADPQYGQFPIQPVQ